MNLFAKSLILLAVIMATVVIGDRDSFADEIWLTEGYLMRWKVGGKEMQLRNIVPLLEKNDGDGEKRETNDTNMEKERWLTVELQVAARGYIGWGLSPQGAMMGADIAIMWAGPGPGSFNIYDYHGQEGKNTVPLLDESQDYELLKGYENETHTVVRFQRKIETCDGEGDMEVVSGPMRIIWSYSDIPNRPGSVEDSLKYHGVNKRGSTSVILLSGYSQSQRDLELPDDIKTFEVLMPNVTVPHDSHTTYWCSLVKLPEVDTKHHVVLVEPVIESQLVHHILVYGCNLPEEVDIERDHAYLSHTGDMCDLTWSMKQHCVQIIAAWSKGGRKYWFPEEAGYPIMPATEAQYVLMEMHYDNPGMKPSVADSSGLRLFYSSMLREYDVGTLMLGADLDDAHFIPPHTDKFTHYGYCSKHCTEKMPKDGITVVGGLQHSHLLGKQMITRHYRDGVELPPIMRDDYYDFNYQDSRKIEPNVRILPGDELIVECHYSSSHRNFTTFSGESTQEEMCLTFLLYYPAIHLDWCLSGPLPREINDVIEADGEEVDWEIRDFLQEKNQTFWSPERVGKLQVLQREGGYYQICRGPAFEDDMLVEESEPFPHSEQQKYVEATECATTPSGANYVMTSCTFTFLMSITAYLMYVY